MARPLSTAARRGFIGNFFPFTLFFLTVLQGKDFWSEEEGDKSCSVSESVMEQVGFKRD